MARFTYMVQRATTKQWLERELPLISEGPDWALSAAGNLTGTLPAGWRNALSLIDRLPMLEEDGTLIHVDADGVHRGAFIVKRITPNEAGELVIEAPGFASYPHDNLFTGDIVALNADPAALYRQIWDHLQSFPDGDLGVEVIGSTPVRIGSEPVDSIPDSGPYVLAWEESPDCGRELEQLANDAPFDWVEETEWDGEDAKLRIRIGYPRLGRRRTDLAFVQGENIAQPVIPERDGALRVSELHGLGAGEGKGSLRHVVALRDAKLRRAGVLTAKDVTDRNRLATMTRAEHARRQATERVVEISVREHPNAPIGSWSLGDDIRVQGTVPHFGDIDLWCRIVSWRLAGEYNAILSLERSDAFNYGS